MFHYFHEGLIKEEYYDPRTRTFVAVVGNEVRTVMIDVTPQYIRNLKALVP